MRKFASKALQIVLSFGVSGFFVWLSLRGVDLREVAQAVLRADVGWILAWFAIGIVIHFARTFRWGLLLQPLGHVGFKHLNVASGAGFMALMVLPLRLGEFARSFLIKRLAGIRMSASMATVVVERVIDMLVIALLVMVTLFGVSGGGERVVYLRTAGTILFIAFAAVLVGLVLAYKFRERAVQIVGRALEPLSAKIARRVSGLLDSFIHGLRVVPSARNLLWFFGLTLGYWGINALGMALLARGFGFSLGAREALTLLAVQVVGVMIPAGPGMLGTFQFFTVLGLSLFVTLDDASRVQAAAYAHTLWALTFAFQVGVGLSLLSVSDVKLGAVVRGSDEVADEVDREGEAAEHGLPHESAETQGPV